MVRYVVSDLTGNFGTGSGITRFGFTFNNKNLHILIFQLFNGNFIVVEIYINSIMITFNNYKSLQYTKYQL